jgi:hypothetical protein
MKYGVTPPQGGRPGTVTPRGTPGPVGPGSPAGRESITSRTRVDYFFDAS